MARQVKEAQLIAMARQMAQAVTAGRATEQSAIAALARCSQQHPEHFAPAAYAIAEDGLPTELLTKAALMVAHNRR